MLECDELLGECENDNMSRLRDIKLIKIHNIYQSLENVLPEYDTILLLSTAKWIHLNFGDEGIKRVFKRIHAQLRPGMIKRKKSQLIYFIFIYYRRQIYS